MIETQASKYRLPEWMQRNGTIEALANLQRRRLKNLDFEKERKAKSWMRSCLRILDGFGDFQAQNIQQISLNEVLEYQEKYTISTETKDKEFEEKNLQEAINLNAKIKKSIENLPKTSLIFKFGSLTRLMLDNFIVSTRYMNLDEVNLANTLEYSNKLIVIQSSLENLLNDKDLIKIIPENLVYLTNPRQIIKQEDLDNVQGDEIYKFFKLAGNLLTQLEFEIGNLTKKSMAFAYINFENQPMLRSLEMRYILSTYLSSANIYDIAQTVVDYPTILNGYANEVLTRTVKLAEDTSASTYKRCLAFGAYSYLWLASGKNEKVESVISKWKDYLQQDYLFCLSALLPIVEYIDSDRFSSQTETETLLEKIWEVLGKNETNVFKRREYFDILATQASDEIINYGNPQRAILLTNILKIIFPEQIFFQPNNENDEDGMLFNHFVDDSIPRVADLVQDQASDDQTLMPVVEVEATFNDLDILKKSVLSPDRMIFESYCRLAKILSEADDIPVSTGQLTSGLNNLLLLQQKPYRSSDEPQHVVKSIQKLDYFHDGIAELMNYIREYFEALGPETEENLKAVKEDFLTSILSPYCLQHLISSILIQQATSIEEVYEYRNQTLAYGVFLREAINKINEFYEYRNAYYSKLIETLHMYSILNFLDIDDPDTWDNTEAMTPDPQPLAGGVY